MSGRDCFILDGKNEPLQCENRVRRDVDRRSKVSEWSRVSRVRNHCLAKQDGVLHDVPRVARANLNKGVAPQQALQNRTRDTSAHG
jgi:hypothetical protein